MRAIGTAGTIGTIGTMWPPSSRSLNLQLEIFFHHLPAIASGASDDRIRRMRGDPDLIQSLYWRPISRELFHRSIGTHLFGGLACHPNRTSPHMGPAAGDIEWIHCDFHFDVIVSEIRSVAPPDPQNRLHETIFELHPVFGPLASKLKRHRHE